MTAAGQAITLNRSEALTVNLELVYTNGVLPFDPPRDTREQVQALVRRLTLEGALRDAVGWNDGIHEDDPRDAFPLSSEAGAALAELLPVFFEDLDGMIAAVPEHEDVSQDDSLAWRERRRLCVDIAERLGAEIPQPVQ